jgi:hypothetical protein
MKSFLLLSLVLLPGGLRADEPLKASAPAAVSSSPVADDQPITDYDGVVRQYKSAYAQQGKPRLLLYINRDLVKDRGETVEVLTVDTSTKTKGDPVEVSPGANVQIGSNSTSSPASSTKATGKGGERLESVTASVRETAASNKGVIPVTDIEAREIEENFQEAFNEAGARFVDQKIALLANRTFAEAGENFLTAPKTDKERQEIESLRQSSDVVIEILARRRPVQILEVSGNDRTEYQLELIATATRLKDGVKVAQVSSNSIYKFNRRNGEARQRRAVRYTNAEITQQVSLALMQRLSS